MKNGVYILVEVSIWIAKKKNEVQQHNSKKDHFCTFFLQINIDKDTLHDYVIYHCKAFFLISAMQNIPSELIITVINYINITSIKMKGSSDLGQAYIIIKWFAW